MEEINNQQEEELLRKVRSKKRIRGLLIFVNVILASYLVFEVVMKTVDYVSYSLEDNEIISLNGNSKNKSLELYNQYVIKNEDGSFKSEDLYDFGIYGNYLNLSKYKIEEGKYSSMDNIGLINVTNNVFESSKNNKTIYKEYLNGGINLNSLSFGDYLVCKDLIRSDNFNGQITPYKIRSEKGIEKIVYSLPDENGKRKKITVKSKDSSPSLVINVSEINSLPNDFYDFVVVGANENFDNQKYKINYVDNLLDAFKTKASYALISNGSDITVSNHIENNSINHVDNYYIDELGGYLTFAGSCREDKENSFVVAPYLNDHENGKFTILINENTKMEDIIKVI